MTADRDRELVDAVHAQVLAHHPAGARETASREEILDALERLPRPLDEDADRRHVTGSAIIVSERGVLLLVHRRLGFWMQPGGHLDPGETPDAAAARETREETGLRARHPADGPQLVHVDVHEAAAHHVHLDLRYLLVAPPTDPSPPPGESQQVQWFSWEEAFTVGDESLHAALAAARPLAEELVGR
jgi:8-oxo-dGTP pyrophosphatase MutT (NUDIX family)